MYEIPWLLALVIAAIPGIAAVVSAVLANRSSHRVKAMEIETQRTRDLEVRLSEKKYDVYKPMLDMFRDALAARGSGSSPFTSKKVGDFAQWISIYGSDDAVKAFHHFMQATFNDAPGAVSLRLYAEFVLAARRDIGVPGSTITATDILGLRLNDLYTSTDILVSTTLPLDDLYNLHDWTPPWSRRRNALAEATSATESE